MKLSRVAEILKKRPSTVEKGTATVDSDFFIPAVGEIDMVGVKEGRLILACVVENLQSRHLRQLPEICRWARENSRLLAQAYRAKGLCDGFSICVWYLCAEVDPEAQLLLPSLADFPLKIYRYRSAGKTLKVEPLSGKPKTEVIKIPTNLNFELNEKELGAFLSSDDEITYTGPDFNS
jgi:hypothetical protein